jgi:hypothetical protein
LFGHNDDTRGIDAMQLGPVLTEVSTKRIEVVLYKRPLEASWAMTGGISFPTLSISSHEKNYVLLTD